jgi:hypothetical protein
MKGSKTVNLKRVGMLAIAALVIGVLAVGSQPPDGRKDGRKDGPKDGKKDGPTRDGPGGPPRFELGKVLPPFAVDQLDLTADQQKQIAEIEKEVKEKLSKILTADQKKKLEDIRPPRGPGGAGGPGGPGGDRGPGGPGEKGDRPERPGRPPEKGDRPPQDR